MKKSPLTYEGNLIGIINMIKISVEKYLLIHKLDSKYILHPLFIVHHSDTTISVEYLRIITNNNKPKWS